VVGIPNIAKNLRFCPVFFLSGKNPADIFKKIPVQEKVEDEQCGEGKTRVIVHRDPRVAGDTKIGSPASTPSATGW
jgi:hypothetical protein